MTSAGQRDRIEAQGVYFNGLSPRAHDAKLLLNGPMLEIREEGSNRRLAEWPLTAMRHVDVYAARRRPLTITVAEEGPLPIGATAEEAAPQDQRLTIDDRSDNGRALTAAILARAGGLAARSKRTKRLIRFAAWLFGGAVVAVSLILFVIIPVSARYVAPLIPPETEVAIGEDFAGFVTDLFGGELCEAPAGSAALAKMTARLEAVSGAHVPLEVRVIRNPEINAFALPGGKIFFFSGLIESAASAEEVAGVLAHEIGHVIGRDSMEAIIRSGATYGVLSLIIGDFSGSFVIVAVGNQVIEARHSREVEAEGR